MKILFFHRWVGVHSGGTETHLIELAKRFCELGHDITILTREGNRFYNNIDERIRIIRVSKNLRESDHSYEDMRVYMYTILFMLKALLKLMLLNFRGEHFDIISVHFTTEAIIAIIFRFFTKTPFIFVLEGYTPHEAMIARYANKRIAISKFEADIYKKKHGLASEVIYIGIDLKRFQVDKIESGKFRAKFVRNGQLLALTVCRLEPRKDITTLLKAAKIVNRENKNIRFIIIGDGILMEDIKQKINQENLFPFVNLLGFSADNDLAYYYNSADIFVLSSKEEWFGIVFLEAMAAGLPIISADVDACPEVIDECGMFFKKGDHVDLSDKILELANNPNLQKSYSLKSRNRAKEFDWRKQILLYENAYRSALKK